MNHRHDYESQILSFATMPLFHEQKRTTGKEQEQSESVSSSCVSLLRIHLSDFLPPAVVCGRGERQTRVLHQSHCYMRERSDSSFDSFFCFRLSFRCMLLLILRLLHPSILSCRDLCFTAFSLIMRMRRTRVCERRRKRMSGH